MTATQRTCSGSRVPVDVDFRRVFRQAADAILILDGTGRYIDANAAACVLTGYTRDEILQMRVGDLAAIPDRQLSAQRFKVLCSQGYSRSNRLIQCKNGTIISVEAHATALQDGIFQTTIRDISDAVAGQAELKRSIDAYSILVDLCGAAVVSCGPDGRIRSWNVAAQELFGYTADEAIGEPVTVLIPASSRKQHDAGFASHVAATGPERFVRILHTEALRKDGSEVPVDISVAVGKRGDEPIFTAVVTDVTQQRDMVEALNDALQQLRFHIDRMPLAYIVWDVDRLVVEWNRAAERIFGYSKAEAMGQHGYELILSPESATTVDAVWKALLAGDTANHSINPNIRKDGTRLLCEWFNTALRDSAGNIRGVASMVMDVSERENTAARIRDAQRIESLGVLAAGIAHDFNSSLMVILGNAALLRTAGDQSSRAAEHLDLIEAAGTRGSELVKQLLTYSRTGRHNPGPTDINTIIQDAVKLIRSSVGKDHSLQLRLCKTSASVIADASQVEQVLMNLCLNAKQAMLDSGEIILETRLSHLTPSDIERCVPHDANPGHYFEIVVRDTGHGMDADTVRRMFDPFFSTKSDGHGLGMAAVLGIVRQHNAVILVDTQPDMGTHMHVYFPLRREGEVAETAGNGDGEADS